MKGFVNTEAIPRNICNVGYKLKFSVSLPSHEIEQHNVTELIMFEARCQLLSYRQQTVEDNSVKNQQCTSWLMTTHSVI